MANLAGPTSYETRTMTRGELDFAVEMAAREGWNPGLHDADSFYRADPAGFLIGLLNGTPIGCISAVSYQGGFGFLGFYIVAPEHRGQGYGIQLWQRALEHLQDHNIGLDGVLEQQANYRKSGFQLAHRNIRYEGRIDTPGRENPRLLPVDQVSFPDLCAYDRTVFPAPREEFLRSWTALPQSKAVALVENEEIGGYGVIRPCRQGYKIGPLFASSAEAAEALFTSLTAHAEPGAKVYLDVPETNPQALELAERHGMTRVFETARMYNGAAPQISTERLFGITTFELG